MKRGGYKAAFTLEAGTPLDWSTVTLSHLRGPEVAQIDRDLVVAGSLASDELAEFEEEVATGQPAAAATWLLEYFKRVRSIYAFKLLSGTEITPGWAGTKRDR